MKSIFLLSLAAAHLSLQAATIFPRMTGKQVVEFTGTRPAKTAEQAKWNFLEEQSANAYIDGVQDAPTGSAVRPLLGRLNWACKRKWPDSRSRAGHPRYYLHR